MSIPPRQNELSKWTILAITISASWLFLLPNLCKPLWHYLNTHLSPNSAEVLVASSTVIASIVSYNLAMLPIYYMEHPFLEQYKIQYNEPWPWRNKSSKVRSDFWSLTVRSIKITAFNIFCLLPLLVTIKVYAYSLLGFQSMSFRADDKSWPTYIELIRDNILMTLIHEFAFYSGHRLMHVYPSLYKYHKIHHEYKHNTSLAAQHNHPVDYILSIVLPALASYSIVQPHSFTIFQWTLWVLFANLDDHCGYSFPWSPVRWFFPFASLTEEHEFHHLKNMGCFGSKLCIYEQLIDGENQWYDRWIEKQNALRSSSSSSLKGGIMKG